MEFSIKQKIKELTTKQSSIVASETYPQYLKAGAGTGKTEVLVQKIIHILNNDSSSDISNFAIITFTNKATEEMKRRISDILYKNWISDGNQRTRKNIDVVSMSNISTIHLFCENLIREFGLQINISPNFKVKSFKKQSDEIVSNILNKYWDKSLLREFQSFTIIRLCRRFRRFERFLQGREYHCDPLKCRTQHCGNNGRQLFFEFSPYTHL